MVVGHLLRGKRSERNGLIRGYVTRRGWGTRDKKTEGEVDKDGPLAQLAKVKETDWRVFSDLSQKFKKKARRVILRSVAVSLRN